MENLYEMEDNDIHLGWNIKQIRKRKHIKQDQMASLVNISQQTVSRYESQDYIDDEMLERFADALGVSVDYIKNYGDGRSIIIENNTFEGGSQPNLGTNITDYRYATFNPLEKLIDLYERLLKSEKEKNELLREKLSFYENISKKSSSN